MLAGDRAQGGLTAPPASAGTVAQASGGRPAALDRDGRELGQNAIKHTAGATVTVRLTTAGDGSLCSWSRTTGPASTRPDGGTGLVGMADRLGAVGGTLRIDAAHGADTRLPAVPQ